MLEPPTMVDGSPRLPLAERSSREESPRSSFLPSWRNTAQRSARGFRGPKEAVANQSLAEGEGLHTAMARKLTTFKVYARNAVGDDMQTGGDSFSVSMRGASFVKPTVHDHEDGSYSIKYRASTSGSYSISISLHGVPLPGSPFALQVLRPAPSAGQPSPSVLTTTRMASIQARWWWAS